MCIKSVLYHSTDRLLAPRTSYRQACTFSVKWIVEAVARENGVLRGEKISELEAFLMEVIYAAFQSR